MTSSHSFRDWHSRTKIFLTAPHALFLFTLIVLTVCIIVTVRAETSRQLKSDRLAQRCAFVYLAPANVTNIGNLAASLKSLNSQGKFDFKYKIIIVHENIPPVTQGRLQAVSEAPLQFRHFTLRPRIDITHTDKTRSNNAVGCDDTKRSKKLFCEHSARFWFYTAVTNDPIKLSPLKDIDYVVRLDSNWELKDKVKRDFFNDFVLSGAQYGYYQQIGQDCTPNATTSLKHLATSYVELNGITPRSVNLWTKIAHTPASLCLPYFHPRLEVLNLRFFRSHSGIQDWIRVVDTNGGIYSEGWKDHVLRFITVSLYAAPEKIVRYDTKIIPFQSIKSFSDICP